MTLCFTALTLTPQVSTSLLCQVPLSLHCLKRTPTIREHYPFVYLPVGDADVGAGCAGGDAALPQAARAHIALSEGLVEDAFAGNLAGDSALRWQYVGFQSGVSRNFPANPTKTNHIGAANDYDPRARPWYLSSVSGAKDVMIVVDCSER